MERRPLGWTGIEVPVIGLGTWKMEADDRSAAITALRLGLDLGMTHIDTAEIYGNGVVERMVGEAIAGRRDGLFLVSKVMPRHASAEGTVRACERSLARLGTDRLDLYLLHWPGPHPLEETIAAFERLVAGGKVRYWGVSNFDVPDLERALAIAGPDRIACNQVLYHLAERAIEHAVLPWCERNRIAVVGYSPFGSGRFPGARSPGYRVLAEIGAAHGVGPRQVALAWLVRRPGLFSIPKSSRVAHVKENARLPALDDAQVRRIEAAFPLGPAPAELPVA